MNINFIYVMIYTLISTHNGTIFELKMQNLMLHIDSQFATF